MLSGNIFFGPRIKELRERSGLSQAELGEIVGVKRAAVSLWESKVSTPNFSVFCALADFFKVSLDYLAGRSDSPKVHKPRKPDLPQDPEEC